MLCNLSGHKLLYLQAHDQKSSGTELPLTLAQQLFENLPYKSALLLCLAMWGNRYRIPEGAYLVHASHCTSRHNVHKNFF